MAESSATESVNRGPRRARKTSQNKYNNNTSDYGSPRTSHKSISGTLVDHDFNDYGSCYLSNQRLCMIDKRSSRRYKESVHEWAQGDADDFKDKDFDFQGNLGLFDKAAIFAEIRASVESCLILLSCLYVCVHSNHTCFG